MPRNPQVRSFSRVCWQLFKVVVYWPKSHEKGMRVKLTQGPSKVLLGGITVWWPILAIPIRLPSSMYAAIMTVLGLSTQK